MSRVWWGRRESARVLWLGGVGGACAFWRVAGGEDIEHGDGIRFVASLGSRAARVSVEAVGWREFRWGRSSELGEGAREMA